MNVILLKDVEHLGESGEVVEVKDGYGRNYLIPQRMARIATPSVIKAVEEEERQQARKRMQKAENAQALADELEDTLIVITAKVGEENRIFGSVTTQQIAVELGNRGFDIDRRNITLDEDVRHIGIYTAQIKLHSDVEADLKIQVMPESGPVEA